MHEIHFRVILEASFLFATYTLNNLYVTGNLFALLMYYMLVFIARQHTDARY